MPTPREILEAALREPLDYDKARRTIRQALDELPGLEADAGRWRGFRRSIVAEDTRWLDAATVIMHAEGPVTAERVDRAADEANRVVQ